MPRSAIPIGSRPLTAVTAILRIPPPEIRLLCPSALTGVRHTKAVTCCAAALLAASLQKPELIPMPNWLLNPFKYRYRCSHYHSLVSISRWEDKLPLKSEY